MPPTLILIRHAQALHNVDGQYDIPDPELTKLGIGEQCAKLKENLMANPLAQNAGLIVVSPMRRTLQTAIASLDWLMDKGIKLEADADWQENSWKPCDTGSPIKSVAQEFPQADFSAVDPVYPDKTSPAGSRYRYSRTAILARGQFALEKLYSRPEKVIVVVSHSGFLRTAVSGTWYFNADYRVFEFQERSSDDEPYLLVQHEDTLENGGGLGLSWKEKVILGADLPDEVPKAVV